MKTAVIFGGTGFIGSFFACHLINNHDFKKVYLFDLESPSEKESEFLKKMLTSLTQIKYIKGDIRNSIDWEPNEKIDLIGNFAAIHREPGHHPKEYYETNLKGAKHVCNWAIKNNCHRIIFTSSIAPYGPDEDEKNELSTPVPESPYGGSKLVAENIHKTWQAKNKNSQLIIIRPGVVFGPGEGGNVTRLIKAVLGRYFLYMGNRETKKAGVYVKELCNAIMWVINDSDKKNKRVTTFNMSMDPIPSVEDFVISIKKTANKDFFIFSVPSFILYAMAYFIDIIAKPLGINHPFSPVRIKKLITSNNIKSQYLIDNGYSFKYTLDEALHDWSKEFPHDFK